MNNIYKDLIIKLVGKIILTLLLMDQHQDYGGIKWALKFSVLKLCVNCGSQYVGIVLG